MEDNLYFDGARHDTMQPNSILHFGAVALCNTKIDNIKEDDLKYEDEPKNYDNLKS